MVPAVAAACTMHIFSVAKGLAPGYQSIKAYCTLLIVSGTRLVGLDVFFAKGFKCANILILGTVLDATVGVKIAAASDVAATNIGTRHGAVATHLQR